MESISAGVPDEIASSRSAVGRSGDDHALVDLSVWSGTIFEALGERRCVQPNNERRVRNLMSGLLTDLKPRSLELFRALLSDEPFA